MTYRISSRKIGLYIQTGHTTTGPRGMPVGFTGYRDSHLRLLEFPHGIIVRSMPWGADMDLPNYGSFGEYVTSAFSRDHKHCVEHWHDEARYLLDAGRRYVLYIGRPQTELDFEVGRWMLKWLDPRIEIAFDASAPEKAGSYTHRLMLEFPDRVFIGEAHPKKSDDSCMVGRPLCYYASERRKVIVNSPAHTPDSNHPEILVAFTGHLAPWQESRDFDLDARAATRWAKQGLTVCFQPWEWERFKGAFEVVGA